MLNLGILASGNGSNLQAIIDACNSGHIDAQVATVISDNPLAFALERARKHNIPSIEIERKLFANTHEFESAIVTQLNKHQVKLICLAGFMRLIRNTLLTAFPKRIINLHPSLLPLFPGLKAPAQALAARATETGCTIHLVDEQMDQGPIIAQSKVAIKANDTAETLTMRIHEQEHLLYPKVIQLFAENRLHFTAGKVCIKDKN